MRHQRVVWAAEAPEKRKRLSLLTSAVAQATVRSTVWAVPIGLAAAGTLVILERDWVPVAVGGRFHAGF